MTHSPERIAACVSFCTDIKDSVLTAKFADVLHDLEIATMDLGDLSAKHVSELSAHRLASAKDAIDNALAILGISQGGYFNPVVREGRLEKAARQLAQVKGALGRFHEGLKRREHGGVAAGNFIQQCEVILERDNVWSNLPRYDTLEADNEFAPGAKTLFVNEYDWNKGKACGMAYDTQNKAEEDAREVEPTRTAVPYKEIRQ